MTTGPLPSPKSVGRLAELDGLRGWAALWVVLFHLGWEIFGVSVPAFRNPVAAAFNGSLAVTVFFVLSGEALSSGFFSGRGLTQVTGLAVKRLPRLSIPVFFCLLLTFAVSRAGLAHDIAPAARLVQRTDWLGAMHPDAITFTSLIKFPLIDVYMTSLPQFDRVPFLWTMNIEMVGSLLVFVILLCWSRLRHFEPVVLALAAVLLLNFPAANLSDFCFGVVIAHWRHRGLFAAWAIRPWVAIAAMLAIVAVLIVSSGAMLVGRDQRIAPVLAPILVASTFLTPWLMRFLSGQISGWLGRISFPLYLVQYPVIVSLTATTIVRVFAHRSPDLAHAAAVVAISTLACLLAATAFLPVETLTKRVGQAIGRALVKSPEEQVAPI